MSIRRFYPKAHIVVADDSRVGRGHPDVEYHHLPFDVGLSAGRNFLLDVCKSEFIWFGDDDFIFTEETDVASVVRLLDRTGLDLIAGSMRVPGKGIRHYEGLLERVDDVLYFVPRETRGVVQGVPLFDMVLNFFVARTAALQTIRWREALKVCDEHADFFLRAKGLLRVGYSRKFCVEHQRFRPPAYKGLRSRTSEFRSVFLQVNQLRDVVDQNFGWWEQEV